MPTSIPPQSDPSRVVLSPSDGGPSRAVIFVDHPGPAFFGGGDTTYACPHCGKAIASLVAPERIWDLVVECGHCRKLSEFPRLPSGAVASGYVFVQKGRYRITSALEAKGALMIGEGAITGGGVRFAN